MARNAFLDDSIHIVNNDIRAKNGLTLIAAMHNEIYFLEAFLAHYRGLGVEKFVLLDDQSDDGSAEFAAKQEDIMLVRSRYRYGDVLENVERGKSQRAIRVWRNSLPHMFANDDWSLQLDLDEFIELPEDVSLHTLIENCDINHNTIWGQMIDVYPETWSEVLQGSSQPLGNIKWYFDAKPICKLDRHNQPKMIYSGARARLRSQYFDGKVKPEKLKNRIRRILNGNPYPHMGNLRKPVLTKWDETRSFTSSHKITNTRAAPKLLPIIHYKFAPNFADRVEYAVKSRALDNNSEGYSELARIFEVMNGQNAPFTTDISRPFTDFQSLKNAHMAIGFD